MKKYFNLRTVVAIAICLAGMTANSALAQAKKNGEVYKPDGISLTYVEGNGSVKGFYIGTFEVTQAEWTAVMGSNPSKFKGDKLPVETVSWDDVQEFLTKLNAKSGRSYRLPTKVEWVYAATGGTNNNYYEYAGNKNALKVAWCADNSKEKPHAVGTKKPNALKIYDMSGNLWEWCNDEGEHFNLEGVGRVLHGGSWGDYTYGCSISSSRIWKPDTRNEYIGFRVVLPSE